MADRYKFLGPRDPASESSVAIIVNGRTIGVGDEFEADDALLSKLGRFKVEKVASLRAKAPSKGTEREEDTPDETLTKATKDKAASGPYPQKGVK